jgi:putative folate metabolism gamma-glutamate ligase
MQVTVIKTPKIMPSDQDILAVIDAALPQLAEGDIVAVTSKIISICEGNIVPMDGADKEQLIVQESDYYLPAELSKYGYHFSIVKDTLISVAGIDESNGEGVYILWPKDAQKTANMIWDHLRKKHGLRRIGVVIVDSTCQPMRRGTTGIALAHSGFLALRNYVGTPDLFGRPMNVTHANVSGGIASTAVFVMGEGAEQTPLCILSDASGVEFQDRYPSPEELALITISREDDLFAPFLNAVEWKNGERQQKR